MSIKQLDNGKFELTVYLGRDENGKQIRKHATLDDDRKKTINNATEKIKQEYKESSLVSIKDMRVSSWCDKWLELNEGNIEESTYVTYKIYINHHFKDYFGNLKLKQINDIHIKQYLKKKLTEPSKNTGKPLSPTTVRKHFFILRRIFSEALKHENPCLGIKPPEKAIYIPIIPNDEEFEKIYNAFRSKSYKLIILLSAKCGLRRGEIFALNSDDIDYENKLIRIDEAKSINREGKYSRKDPKSKAGVRKVPCPDSALDEIKKYNRSKKSIGKEMFSTRPDNLSSEFSDRMKKIGLQGIRFHDLRHYYASWLYEQGIQDHIAAEIMGHDIMVLKQIYQHIGVDKKKEVFEHIRNLQDNKIVELPSKNLPKNLPNF